MTSPKKSKVSSKDLGLPEKPDAAKVFVDKQSSRKPTETLSEAARAAEAAKELSDQPQSMVPITPAPTDLNLFSPLSSEPPTAQQESRDTPPPTDLNSDSTNGAGRPSRRQRASVSYAEPNLRDKMRRPTKELVDAVTADAKISKPLSAVKLDNSREEDAKDKDAVSIKKEDEPQNLPMWATLPHNNSRWNKNDPASPLVNKASKAMLDLELPASTLPDRTKKTAPPTTEPAARPPSSASSTAIAALVAGSQKRLSRAREAAEAARARNGITEKVNAYDLHDVLPSADGKEPGPRSSTAEALQRSRRYSSMSEMGKKADPSGSALARARSGRRRETLSVDLAAKADGSDDEANVGGGKVVLGRGERAAMRRKSMLL